MGPGSASPLVSIKTRLNRGGASAPASALRDQAPQQRDLQVGARSAAQAPVAQQRATSSLLARTSAIVDADGTELVDHDSGAGAFRRGEETPHQRGLAGTQEAGDDGHRNARAARMR